MGSSYRGLKNKFSPERIAGTTMRANEPIQLSHETIYQAICAMPKAQLRTKLITSLRFVHSKRWPPGRESDQRGEISNMTNIDQCSSDIAERLVPGNWKKYHTRSAGNRSQVDTLVERKSRFLALITPSSEP